MADDEPDGDDTDAARKEVSEPTAYDKPSLTSNDDDPDDSVRNDG